MGTLQVSSGCPGLAVNRPPPEVSECQSQFRRLGVLRCGPILRTPGCLSEWPVDLETQIHVSPWGRGFLNFPPAQGGARDQGGFLRWFLIIGEGVYHAVHSFDASIDTRMYASNAPGQGTTVLSVSLTHSARICHLTHSRPRP
jgi:hypothetical protein